jgi:hypothetical protein
MPFRFRRSFGPRWLKLNVSKTGLSVSSGVPGFHVNQDLSGRRKKPTRVTVGLPGTGLSYYENFGGEPAPTLLTPPPAGEPTRPESPWSRVPIEPQPKRRRTLRTLIIILGLLTRAIVVSLMAH